MKRILTSLVLIPAIGWTVIAAPEWAFILVLGAVGVLAFLEYSNLVAAHDVSPPGPLGYAAGLTVMVVPAAQFPAVLSAMLALWLGMQELDLRRALARAGAFLLGVYYIFGSWRCAIELRAVSPFWLLFALVVVWAGDIAALYIGRAWGKRRLSPRVSPAKTWEGTLGSVLGSLAVALGFWKWALPPGTPLWSVVALAVIGNAAGQVGDLAESALKRGANFKDSGTMLPGHGGWLDRIDASLFSVPAVLFAGRLLRIF
jgi:phosphatidate cytidylyltransferase